MGTIIRAALMYWFLLFVLRLTGRRAMNHMTPFEMILVFLFGGLAVQAIVGDDHSLTNAWLAILTVSLIHVLIAMLKHKSERFGRIADGTPVIIFRRGEWLRDRMKYLHVQEPDVLAAARNSGVERLEQIKYAIVERNGSISIIKNEAA
jgi:uncharacterized membrane protein YcaP (DUF421 family)